MLRPSVGILLAALIFVGAVVVPATGLSAADPLHVQVDRLVAESPLGLVSGESSDGEFLRRLYLAVVGRIDDGMHNQAQAGVRPFERHR